MLPGDLLVALGVAESCGNSGEKNSDNERREKNGNNSSMRSKDREGEEEKEMLPRDLRINDPFSKDGLGRKIEACPYDDAKDKGGLTAVVSFDEGDLSIYEQEEMDGEVNGDTTRATTQRRQSETRSL